MDIKDPKVQKSLLVGILIAAVSYLYFFAGFMPFGYQAMQKDKKQLQAKYEQLSSDLEKARQTAANMPRVEREFELVQRRYTAAQKLLPEEREVANLLRMVSLVGQQEGVKFDLFKPAPQIVQGYYIENPVDVKVVGGYHEVGAFLAEVANLSRIINVARLNLKTYDKGTADETVEASFTASAYTMNPNPPTVGSEEGADGKGKDGAAKKGSAKKGARGSAPTKGAKKSAGKEAGHEG